MHVHLSKGFHFLSFDVAVRNNGSIEALLAIQEAQNRNMKKLYIQGYSKQVVQATTNAK